MAQHGHPDLLVDPLFHLIGQLRTHTGETLMAELVDTALAQRNRTRNWLGAFGDHANEVRVPTLEAPFDEPAHLLDIEGLLGNQRHVRARSHSGVQRDPAGVSAHHLHQHHPLVGFGGAMQSVDRVGGYHQRGVVTESHVGAVDIVVDGFRHADHGNVLF